MAQHYSEREIPGCIILNIDFDQPALMVALTEQCGHRINLVFQPQGQRRQWLELAQKGAEISLQRLGPGVRATVTALLETMARRASEAALI